MKFRDFKLGVKQSIGFGLILAIMAAVNLYAIREMAALRDEIDEVTTNWLPRVIAIADINANTSDLRINQLQHAFVTGDEEKEEQALRMIALIDRMEENLDRYEELKRHSMQRGLYSAREESLHTAFSGKWERYAELYFDAYQYSINNENEKAVALLGGEAQLVFADFSRNLEELVQVINDGSFYAAQNAELTFKTTRTVTIVLLVVTVFLSVFMAVALVRVITRPVRQLEMAAARVAEGDLSVRLDIPGRDEVGNLAQSFNQMTSSLHAAQEKTSQQAAELQHQHEKLQTAYQDLQEAMQQLQATQAQLLQSEKVASLGKLVAGVVHELNTPVGVIKSSLDSVSRAFSHMIEEITTDRSIEEQATGGGLQRTLTIVSENTQLCVSASTRLSEILENLKGFARLDQAEFAKVDLHQGLDQAISLMGSDPDKQITMIKEYGDIPRIACFPRELNQVFMNLLTNAAQAIGKRGTIIIRTFSDGEMVSVQVCDTGIGIAPEKMKNLFDPDFSKKGSRVKAGVGLFTCYHIMQQHRGRIEVQSELGKGTTFTITMPCNLARPITE